MIRVLLLLMLAAAPAFATAPGPVQCLSVPQIRTQRIVDGAMLFKSGSRWYRNEMSSACPALRPDSATETRTPMTRLCAGDIVRIFDPRFNIERGACAFGEFVPVDAPGPTRKRGR